MHGHCLSWRSSIVKGFFQIIWEVYFSRLFSGWDSEVDGNHHTLSYCVPWDGKINLLNLNIYTLSWGTQHWPEPKRVMNSKCERTMSLATTQEFRFKFRMENWESVPYSFIYNYPSKKNILKCLLFKAWIPDAYESQDPFDWNVEVSSVYGKANFVRSFRMLRALQNWERQRTPIWLQIINHQVATKHLWRGYGSEYVSRPRRRKKWSESPKKPPSSKKVRNLNRETSKFCTFISLRVLCVWSHDRVFGGSFRRPKLEDGRTHFFTIVGKYEYEAYQRGNWSVCIRTADHEN